SRVAAGQAAAGGRAGPAAETGRPVESDGITGGGALHIPVAGASDVLILRYDPAAAAAQGRAAREGQELRSEEVPRLHPCPGPPSAGPAAYDGVRELREEAGSGSVESRSGELRAGSEFPGEIN